MSECPNCHQAVSERAIACPYCRTSLKAFGHPGITLHQSQSDYLCKSCLYHQDDTCTFPQRPYAKTCTLYTSSENRVQPPAYRPPMSSQVGMWLRQNSGWVLLGLVAAVSMAIAFSN
jgi:C4-type Zn-finger protein